MSESEFRDLRRRWLLILSAVTLAAAFTFLATFPLIGLMRQVLLPVAAGLRQPWREIIPTLPIVLLPSLPAITLLIAIPQLKRRFAPKCPHCSKAIIENAPLHFLFTTRRCIYCTMVVFTDTRERCRQPQCAADATLRFFPVEGRRCVREELVCEAHARELWASFASSRGPRGRHFSWPSARWRVDERLFDFVLVVYDERAMQTWTHLKEVQGARELTLRLGAAEGWALLHELRQVVSPRPLTHRAMARVIEELGGQVQDVLIDAVDENRTYHAKIRIQQDGRSLLVDVRPSDALTLAVVCNVPVLVGGAALREL